MAPTFKDNTAFLYRQFFLTPPKAPSSVNLKGQLGIVTGSNTGLGFYACKQLLGLGLSHLILAVRDTAKGEAAKTSLLNGLPSSTGKPTIDIWSLDLGSYESIFAFAEKLKQSGLKPDFAILNAGVVKFDFELNPSTSNEETVQTNWLSTSLLTLLLLPILDASASSKPSRPVLTIVGSEVGAWANFEERKVAEEKGTSILSVLNDKAYFDASERYSTSKLLGSAFVHMLAKKRAASSVVASNRAVINIVNPGLCYGSELHRQVPGAFGFVFGVVKRIIGRSPTLGARTLVHAGVWAGPESDGRFLSDGRDFTYPALLEREDGAALEEELWKEMMLELGKDADVAHLLEGVSR